VFTVGVSMPNLVGVWDRALSSEAVENTLARQLQRVRVPDIPYEEYKTVYPGFGMALMDHGILENGCQPACSQDGRYSLLLDGELLNCEELKTHFRAFLPPRPLSSPDLCLELLTKCGSEVVASFNGLFCIVLYDALDRGLTIISDRYGFRPLFLGQSSNSLLFASELKALVAADEKRKRLDEIGTLELFCYGSQFMERTWIDGYIRISPATILTFNQEGCRRRRYWTYAYDEDARTLDQETYFSVFGTLLDRAVERAMRGSKRIGIFLSGGYDSRSVAASIRKHHLPIPAVTFGQADSRDVRFASLLAQRLGLEHTALTAQGPYLYSYCRSIVWRTEGMIPFANTTSIRYHSLLKQKMEIILTGFLAEFGGSHTWPRLLMARTRRTAIDAIFDRFLARRMPAARRIFRPEFFARAWEGLRHRFEKSFEEIPNDKPMNMADCWNLIHIQPRTTYQAPSIDRHLFEARAPHMDAELVSFLLTIPPLARIEQRVYKKMIAYQFPAIRDVPCTNSGRPIDPHFAREYTKMVARYAAGKAAAAIRRSLRVPEPLGREFRDLNDDIRAEPQLADLIIRPLLRAGVFPPDMFNHEAIEQILTDHFEKNGRHENIISLLVSWGLAAKFILGSDVDEIPPEMFRP
jgi:asparagine synthetase B (glutamine-hydrolysing)